MSLADEPSTEKSRTGLRALMTRARWIEVLRIVVTGSFALAYWRGLVPVQVLWCVVAFGLYPLVKTGLVDLVRERKIGTEIFVTVATLVALVGGEVVAGAVLMSIILVAEFIAELNTDRARASIKALIGAVPRTALLRAPGGDRVVPIDALKTGDVVLVHVLGITAALLGWIGPIQAAVLHLGPDILVFVNSVKLLRVRIPGA